MAAGLEVNMRQGPTIIKSFQLGFFICSEIEQFGTHVLLLVNGFPVQLEETSVVLLLGLV